MTSSLRQQASDRLDRLLDALIDPARRDRAVIVLLAAYAVVWTLFAALAKASRDVHFDMGEAIAWAREETLGTPKHPPLSAWIARVWFSIFPLTDWAFYALGIAMATLSLWAAWKVSERYLDGEKRIVGLALLTLVPFYNFHILKFNVNSAMLLPWAFATLWFLQSLETRRALPAALAGLAAAAAMLAKYWSVYLLLGLALAALTDPRRRDYFRSPAPWITIATGTAALAPHVVWLYLNEFKTFDYALQSHASAFWPAALSGLEFLVHVLGYIFLPVLLVLIAARPTRAAIADTLAPQEPERRTVLIAWAAPLLLGALAAPAFKSNISSLWAMGGMTLLMVVLLSSPQLAMPRAAARWILLAAILFPLACVAGAPLAAIVVLKTGLPHHATQYRPLARAVEETWRATSDRPLRFFGGHYNLLFGTAFYLKDQPSTFDIVGSKLTPWANDGQIARAGYAIACAIDDPPCVARMEERAAHSPGGVRREVEITRRYLGMTDVPARYLILTVPPQQGAADADPLRSD